MPAAVRLACSLAALTWSAVASAAEAGGAQRCTAIADALERLACYDRLHGRAGAPEEDVMPRAEPAAPPPAAAEFGAEQLPEPPDTVADRADEIVSTVIGVGEQLTGRHWFRLGNGQLWSQVSPERTAVDVGDSVRISRSALNTYSLRRADGSSRSTAVRRLE